jgi:hypothetical protein
MDKEIYRDMNEARRIRNQERREMNMDMLENSPFPYEERNDGNGLRPGTGLELWKAQHQGS